MEFRNIAIIAHVDHGKTTLVDNMLKQSGAFEAHKEMADRVMDSNDLEKERGITISAKCTSIEWKNYRINIVDTPGHADFGGEVERILSMVDGVVLLVDSAEGCLPQTKFVLTKALGLGLKPMVVVNKVDRGDARPHEVHDEVFDLFDKIGANDEQLDFPTLFAVGRDGWAVEDYENDTPKDLSPLFDLIIDHVPAPTCAPEKPFAMLTTLIESDPYVGRVLTGKVYNGNIKVGSPIKAISLDGKKIEQGKVTKIMAFRGVERTSVSEAIAGDIISIAGLSKATVADTICDLSVEKAFEAHPIDPPTLSMTFSVNDSPFAGQEGDKLTSRVIAARLFKEAESNVALKVEETEDKNGFIVSGRGELQLGVLIETLRREGFELSISRPHVVYKYEDGQKLEPIEEVIIDVEDEFSGIVIEKMNKRKGIMSDLRPSGDGKTRITFYAPSRGLIGYLSEFRTDTRGTGVMNRLFHNYEPFKGEIEKYRSGVLISMENGVAAPFALFNLEARGVMFIDAGVKVYDGMIIGEHSQSNDLEVNPIKGKQLTNIRASGKDEAVKLTTPITMSLEEAISYIHDDELVEVTPESMRLRKKHLSAIDRKKALRAKNK
ncbi:MAG: translational GTPase TypA [Alphaproteobacteria bacterium]|jgi:GTP-binding protein|nr:translational GTPase TypA [Alphaproteobacteria bacterium]